ncbi:MAG TPA: potassium channel family protein [Nitrospira sp.]|nr:potassium channel family protein [Nitrospira sp.]
MARLHRLHSRALKVLALAAVLDMLAGVAFTLLEHVSLLTGLYWAVTTATTVGYGDVTPRTNTGHALAIIVMLTVIPLFAATFSLITSGLTSSDVQDSETRIKRHVEARLKHHLGHDDTDDS